MAYVEPTFQELMQTWAFSDVALIVLVALTVLYVPIYILNELYPPTVKFILYQLSKLRRTK